MVTTIPVNLGPVAHELGIPAERVERTVQLLDDGNTVPFLTRYRKDETGGLDEEQIRRIQDKVLKLRLLAERKRTILKSIESQGKLTPELADQINAAGSTKRLEDLYLPYKPKKQTLAALARQRGLAPLARELLDADPAAADIESRAADFVSADRFLHSVAEVLLGVGHVLAERFSESVEVRGKLRNTMRRTGKLVSRKVASVSAPAPATPEPATPASEPAASVSEPGEAASATAPPAGSPPAPEIESSPLEVESPSSDTPPTAAGIDSEAGSPPATSAPPPGALPSSAPEASAAVLQPKESGATPPDGPASPSPPGADEPPAEPCPAEGSAGPDDASASQKPDAASGGAAANVATRRKRAAAGPKSKKEKKRERLEAAFKDYFEFEEPIARIPPHRVLAVNRGERAKVLRAKVEADFDGMAREAMQLLVPPDHVHAEFLRACVRDALTRLVFPSLEREIRRELTERAEEHAVSVFARNLRKLLLQAPVRGRRVLAVDPGLRSGCKLSAIDEFGNVLEHTAIHVVGGEERRRQGRAKLVELIQKHDLSVAAIGNGTGCRHVERLFAEVIAEELKDCDVAYVVVNEAGASVYSTSPVGREELPQYDAVLRGAISIGRRLLDPLSELVKINPASIGVGMYQHDVKARHLRESLDAVVESCVNYVGVDVNTASPALLRYVSGLNQLTARRLFEYRLARGPFRDRGQFKDVPGLGEMTFLQAAGFLRIPDGENPLDGTWIHPESYDIARRVLEKLGASVSEVSEAVKALGLREEAPPAPAASPTGGDDPAQPPSETAPPTEAVAPCEGAPADSERDSLAQRLAKLDVPQLSEELEVGPYRLQDILDALKRPGRDPRDDLPPPVFRRGVLKLEDLQPQMELSGVVLNVVDFGAFVDIGLSDCGLVHISRLADRYVRDPHDIVSVGDILTVWVVEVDQQRRRVSLTAIKPGTETPPEARRRGKQGADGKSARPAPRPSRPGRAESRKPRGGQHERRGRSRTDRGRTGQRSRRKPPPAPLTEDMKDGKEPMRSFSDLLQFYEDKPEATDTDSESSS